MLQFPPSSAEAGNGNNSAAKPYRCLSRRILIHLHPPLPIHIGQEGTGTATSRPRSLIATAPAELHPLRLLLLNSVAMTSIRTNIRTNTSTTSQTSGTAIAIVAAPPNISFTPHINQTSAEGYIAVMR